MIPDNQTTTDPVSGSNCDISSNVGDDGRGSSVPILTPIDMIHRQPVECASTPENSLSPSTFASADPTTLSFLPRSVEDSTTKEEKKEDQDEKLGLDFHNDKDTLSGESIPMEGETSHQHHRLKDISQVDDLLAQGKKRNRWYQVWRPKHGPPKPPNSLDDVGEIPLATASIFSQLTYSWVTPLMTLGYQRPLMATDLWKMDKTREARLLSDKFMEAYTKRELEAKTYNAGLTDPVNPIRPSRFQRFKWHLELTIHPRRCKTAFMQVANKSHDAGAKASSRAQRFQILEEEWRLGSGRRKASIVMSLNDTMSGFWAGGLYKVIGDTAQLMCPLLTKALINFSKEAYYERKRGEPGPSIGKGIGYAIGLFFLVIMASVCQHQFFFRSMASGVMARAALISATFKRSIVLAPRSRAQHPQGKILSHLSSDISRIDYCCQWFHAIWTAPIQLIVTMILLLVQIGPSALVGMSLFVVLTPLQTWFMKLSFKVRQSSMQWTDGRSKLLQELLSSMAIIKQFTYEIPFLKRLSAIRGNELRGVRSIMIIRAANQALAFSVPILASVVSFAAYILGGGNNVDPAVIFTSLSYFMLLRQPLMFLPRALSSLADAQTALQRLGEFFAADITTYKANIDSDLDVAIKVENATFEWMAGEEALSADKHKTKRGKKSDTGTISTRKDSTTKPFRIVNLDFVVPRGQLVAVVGPIGSGKSSLLSALVGEMNRISGNVTFCGSLGYCQQNAWIQNLSVRENILFGAPYDEDRYWRAVKAAALPPDLELFADGDMTEIGERGVNLSGGQKSRLNIARAFYSDAEIVLLDDPLSAVDAHVGLHLFEEAILALKATGKTVVLVTHALHLLSKQVDYIYSIDDGRFAEQGTYNELMRANGAFRKLVEEFGGQREQQWEEDEVETEKALEAIEAKPILKQKITRKMMGSAAGTGKLEGRLMKGEVRKTGSVGMKVYMQYLRAGEAKITGPLTLVAAVLMQGCNILSMLWITYWEADQFQRSQNFYMGIYAALGIAQAFFTFALGATIGILSYFASRSLYSKSLHRLFHTPMSFLSTTPIGRIMSVYGKDIDTIDSNLSDSFRMFLMTIASVIGSVVIITVYLHYFLPVVAVVLLGYAYFAMFYRASAREVKRLDSILRSLLYSHFGESLSGLSTIRAYNAIKRFEDANDGYVDLENRAYLLTTANQRWLAIRLDFCGAILIFCVAVMAATNTKLSPSVIGLTLTYLTSLVQMFGMMTRQSAELENNMNAVERVLYYASEQLPQEQAHVIPDTEPPASWPERGQVDFKDIVMSYREGLPTVLHGINLHIEPGASVGILGRSGAGKSSLTQVLFRLVELTSGSIHIDGVDVSSIGLATLRSRLSLIPQEPLLFSGTIRSNLDPFDRFPDANLLDAMRKAALIDPVDFERMGEGDEQSQKPRFNLETPVESEGQNLSVGERALLSLARALVNDSKIIILDEATASTDAVTDAKIQETIRREFSDKTVLCIAHRLRTVISFDKILVMDAGMCKEYAGPLELFSKEDSLFRSLCIKSDITLEDIQKAQNQAGRHRKPS